MAENAEKDRTYWLSRGLGIRESGLYAGQPYGYYFEVPRRDGTGTTIMLDPLQHRADARAGRLDAIRYCEMMHIPWRMDDEGFLAWRRSWINRMREQVVRLIVAVPKKKGKAGEQG